MWWHGAEQRKLCEHIQLKRGTTWSHGVEHRNCNDMRLNRGTLCDYIGHYLMTWDRAKETIGWYRTEWRKSSLYAAKHRQIWIYMGPKRGNIWSHRDEQRKFLYYHKTHCLSFARNITLQVQPRTTVIHSWNRKNCDGRRGGILCQH
jgi:hypothetical protein